MVGLYEILEGNKLILDYGSPLQVWEFASTQSIFGLEEITINNKCTLIHCVFR